MVAALDKPEPIGIGVDEPIEADKENDEQEAEPDAAVGPPRPLGGKWRPWVGSALAPIAALVLYPPLAFHRSPKYFGNVVVIWSSHGYFSVVY